MKGCGVKTIKGVIATFSLIVTVLFLARLLEAVGKVSIHCNSPGADCSFERLGLVVGAAIGGSLFLCIVYVIMRQALVC